MNRQRRRNGTSNNDSQEVVNRDHTTPPRENRNRQEGSGDLSDPREIGEQGNT